MNWNRLKQNKCPNCNLPLVLRAGIHACTGKKCQFGVRAEHFDAVIQKLYRKGNSNAYMGKSAEQSLQDLNNLEL